MGTSSKRFLEMPLGASLILLLLPAFSCKYTTKRIYPRKPTACKIWIVNIRIRFIVLLSLSLLTHFIAELIIFLKARRQESVWRYFSFLKYNFQKKKFSLAGIPTLKIGDLVLIISGNIAPVDLLLLDCGVMKYGENTCRVNEDRIYGRPNIVNKRSIRKFDEETSEQDRVKSYEHIPKLVEQLTGQIEYGPPIEGVMHIKGSFKLRNDPRISPMNYNNILFSGSKLATNWAFGMVLFNGKTSSIIRKNRLAQCIKRGHAKKYGSFFGLSNRINAVFVVLSFIFGFAFLSYYSLSKKNMVFFFFSNQSKSNRTGCQSICSFL